MFAHKNISSVIINNKSGILRNLANNVYSVVVACVTVTLYTFLN